MIEKENNKISIYCSYMEIYNEQVYDLLQSKSDKLTLRKDKIGNTITGSSEINV